MTDRELLELAAKAADYRFNKQDDDIRGIYMLFGYPRWWNPLTDDGDALRLAVKLKFDIEWDFNEVSVNYAAAEFEKEDPYAATRRAIVRAAAAIGETL